MRTIFLMFPVSMSLLAQAAGSVPTSAERVFEATFESSTAYADPFNDVDVDVLFEKNGQSWRVPTFWNGGSQWTVRFAAPAPGEYTYHLESTDRANRDLNGHEGKVTITAYAGANPLLGHGMIRVSANKRYFEQADGTPFYWLGDTWWSGLSDRLSWDGFQRLTADRKAKGFTVVQIVAGLIPDDEEVAPVDPGYANEGGQVWDAQFKRINPRYFDYADRRIQYLLDAGMTPAIVGAWGDLLSRMGVEKMKRHWRYVVARYGAYPVFWILGGEVFDPPDEVAAHLPAGCSASIESGWTEVARYLRVVDPYHHPLTVHESPPHCDYPLQDESLTDFDLFQSSHFGWASLATSVAQIGRHYARTSMIKPVVQGEIGYERLGEAHLEDFQRAAFWLSMLNGAAGHTYGAVGVWEAYTAERLSRHRYSFLTWEEGMNLPGSQQVGLGAKWLRSFPWWRFAPHPQWVTPRGTTLLEPQSSINGFDLGQWDTQETAEDLLNEDLAADSQERGEFPRYSFRRPYAAGIPREVRVIYMPFLGFEERTPPTVLALETNVRYRAYFWQPALGIKIELGTVERPAPGTLIFSDSFSRAHSSAWKEYGKDAARRKDGALIARGDVMIAVNGMKETNAVITVRAQGAAQAALLLRYRDIDDYVAAVYSPQERQLYLLEREHGMDGKPLGRTALGPIGSQIRLSAEVREGQGMMSITDGEHTYSTPIVDLSEGEAGSLGLLHRGDATQRFESFEIRHSPRLVKDGPTSRKVYDAQGGYRGELVGGPLGNGPDRIPGWSEFGRDKHILLDAYRPERMPTMGDWVLVLDARETHPSLPITAPQAKR